MNEFYYEFSRESTRIKSMVDKLRDRDKRGLPYENNGDPFGPMIIWLSGLKWFPDYPWENPLKDEAIARGFKRAGIDPKAQPDSLTGRTKRILSDRPIIQEFSPGNRIKPSERVVKFDWRASDRELREEFERIIQHRPSEYQHIAYAAEETLPALLNGNPGFKLPFKMSSALNYLQIYRRRKEAGTWMKYLKRWDSDRLRDIQQLIKNGYDREEAKNNKLRRPIRNEANVKKIIAWFDGKLSTEEFQKIKL